MNTHLNIGFREVLFRESSHQGLLEAILGGVVEPVGQEQGRLAVETREASPYSQPRARPGARLGVSVLEPLCKRLQEVLQTSPVLRPRLRMETKSMAFVWQYMVLEWR